MSEAKNLFPLLQQAAEPGIVGAIEKLVRDAPDRDLCRVNVLDFAAKRGLDEEKSIAAFLHAARLGLPCRLELGTQTEFSEPPVRINTDFLDATALGWSEAQAWDEFVSYYAATRLHDARRNGSR